MCTYKDIANYVERYERLYSEARDLWDEAREADDRLKDLPRHCSKEERTAAAEYSSYLWARINDTENEAQKIWNEARSKYGVDIDDYARTYQGL